MVIYYIGHVYLRPYVYSFCQIFQALCLFPALRLFRRLEYIVSKTIHYLLIFKSIWRNCYFTKNFDPESKVYINVFLWHPVLLRVFWRGKAYYIRSSKLEKKSTSTQWGISRKFHSYWLQQFITSEILAPVKLTYIFQNSKTNIRFIIRFLKLITIEKLQKKAMLGCNESSNGCGKNFKTEIDFNL